MTITELAPFVRYVHKRIYDTTRGAPVYAYDFRLFYIHDGHGAIDIDGHRHDLGMGTLVVIPPATPYRLIGGDLFLTVLNFDIDYRVTERATMPPCEQAFFQPELVHRAPPCAELARPFVIDSFPEGENTLYRIQNEWDSKPLWADERISSLLRSLLILALRRLSDPSEALSPLLREVLQYIELHYTEQLTNKQIAEEFHYHPYYLNKCFVAAMGTPLHRYLIERRIRAAKQLLVQSGHSIEKIAEEVGFLSHAHFTKMFREATGLTPHVYRAGKRAEEI